MAVFAPLARRFPHAERAAATRRGINAVAVVDVATGQAWGNDTACVPIRSASIIKTAILLAVLDARKGGPLSPPETADAEAMIRRSDNDATTRFWRALGGARVVDYIHRATGTRDTRIAPENPAWWGYTRTTARDMAVLLAGTANHQIAPPGACEYLLSEMRQVIPEQRWGLAEGCARPGAVAVKNGWYPEEREGVWRVHSLAVAPAEATPGFARGLAVAVLTRYPLALGMAYGQETCRRVGAALLR